MQKNEQNIQEPHMVTLKNKKDLFLSGILEVLSATESEINLKTTQGPLIIYGSKLKIKNLSEEQKELSVDGDIHEIKYNSKKRFLEKCFR